MTHAEAVHTLVFARCAGFSFRAPGFSHPSVAPPVRAGLALFLTFAVLPAVPSASFAPDGLSAVIAIATEFVLGTTMGMAASIVYDAAYAGGRAVDDYVGVKAIAPSVELVAPSGFGRIWSLVFTGGYFLSGAYRPTVYAFALSFARVPPGTPFDAHAALSYVVALASTVALVGATVAAPAIALAFVVQVALGALSRAVPRFGSVTLAFPLAFAAALIATVLCISDR